MSANRTFNNSGAKGRADAKRSASALEILDALPLTAAGRPILHRSEVEVYTEENINIYDRDNKTSLVGGRCTVTNHRLLYSQGHAKSDKILHLPLEYVDKVTKEAGFLARSAKIRLDLKLHQSPELRTYMKLSFKSGGRDAFYNPLVMALDRKAWIEPKTSHVADKRLKNREFSASDAGVAGILRRQQEAQKESSEMADTAFSDLTALMSNAKNIVDLMERYESKLKSIEREASCADSERQEYSENLLKVDSMMLDMGIINPVTRENAGKAYFNQLARQLAEFLTVTMPEYGGIMTLTDVYCLFNRARGIELISPNDLYHAASLQRSLKLGFHTRKFSGGLQVLQAGAIDMFRISARDVERCKIADSYREDRITGLLQKMAVKSFAGFITITDVCAELQISYPLAREYLKAAENVELLCHDDTLEGLNFYPNLFDSFERSLTRQQNTIKSGSVRS